MEDKKTRRGFSSTRRDNFRAAVSRIRMGRWPDGSPSYDRVGRIMKKKSLEDVNVSCVPAKEGKITEKLMF